MNIGVGFSTKKEETFAVSEAMERASSSGIISKDKVVTKDSGALGVMLISGIQAGVACVTKGEDVKSAAREAAENASGELNDSPNLFLLITSPGEEEKVLEGIKQYANLPIKNLMKSRQKSKEPQEIFLA